MIFDMVFNLFRAIGLFSIFGFINAAPIESYGRGTSEAIASREYFYVGGNYVLTSLGTLFSDQMYVEKLSPVEPTQPYPLVFIHGQAQTGTVRQLLS